MIAYSGIENSQFATPLKYLTDFFALGNIDFSMKGGNFVCLIVNNSCKIYNYRMKVEIVLMVYQ